jgi:hypothetical protein
LMGAVVLMAACEHSVDSDTPGNPAPEPGPGQGQGQEPGPGQEPEPGPGGDEKPAALSVTWFVSDAADPLSEPAGKAETLKEGLSQIRAAHKEGAFAGNKKAVIVIDGTVTPGREGSLSNKSLVSIAGAGEYPPLVLRGGEAGGTLDGQNRVRVLYVEGNKVTIAKGLTLTRGNASTLNEMYGGGVYLEKSSLTMADGAISDCTAKYGSGVAVFEDEDGTHSSFKMTGGTIKGGSGSAVFVDSACIFTLSDSGLITGNGLDGSTDEGGGVQVNGHGIFNMFGGTIQGNRAAAYGGGVKVNSKGAFFMTGGTITENTAPDDGGSGLHLPKYNTVFVLKGGSINGNHGIPDIVKN